MDDEQIVELYWQRNENAINCTAEKYGKYCYSVAYNILGDASDSEESVNDTYLDAWNSMPPHRPSVLSAFLGKITRRTAIDKWRRKSADKRGSGQVPDALEELSECIPDKQSVESSFEAKHLSEVINDFIRRLPETEQKVFVRRYWHVESIQTISDKFGFSQSKVKSMLFRTRDKLRERLSREGLV